MAVAEIYLQGVSTRRVTKVMEELSAALKSLPTRWASAKLDDMLEEWRYREITDEIVYLIVDARYEKVRVSSQVRSCALPIGIGIRKSDGKRLVLGCSVALSEAEVAAAIRRMFNANDQQEGDKCLASFVETIERASPI